MKRIRCCYLSKDLPPLHRLSVMAQRLWVCAPQPPQYCLPGHSDHSASQPGSATFINHIKLRSLNVHFQKLSLWYRKQCALCSSKEKYAFTLNKTYSRFPCLELMNLSNLVKKIPDLLWLFHLTLLITGKQGGTIFDRSI